MAVNKAVILARGLGTRMRRPDPKAPRLDNGQARMADAGIKAMIPVGRPFLDYVISGLADAGYREVCLVVGPEHDALRDRYTRECIPARVAVEFAVQERPLGTADAVAAAEAFAGGDGFLVLNSDNYYPTDAIRDLRRLGRPGLAAFERLSLIRESNISGLRIRQFALVSIGPDGMLERIVEKPDESEFPDTGAEVFVSMNCWVFGPSIFRACRSIKPSPRGELELTDAVQYAMRHWGERFQVLQFRSGVLDLSNRSDIAAVTERLRGIRVAL